MNVTIKIINYDNYLLKFPVLISNKNCSTIKKLNIGSNR